MWVCSLARGQARSCRGGGHLHQKVRGSCGADALLRLTSLIHDTEGSKDGGKHLSLSKDVEIEQR